MHSFFRSMLLAAALLLPGAGCSTDTGTEPPVGYARVPIVPVTGTVQAADGVRIVYEARGEGDTAVVFVHCWACNRRFWRHQIDAVLDAGYRVVTLDLPGHGESGSDRETWSVADLAADVKAVADALELERVVLVGHSMGGPVSLALAARDVGRVKGIACVDTLHNVEFQWPEGLTDQIAGRLQADYRGGVESFVPQLFLEDADPGIVRWVMEQAVASSHPATIALMRDFSGMNMQTMLAAAGVPVRCINAAPAGEQGMATATGINRKYADFDVVLMERVGHYPQLERPDEFNAILLAVLADLTSAD